MSKKKTNTRNVKLTAIIAAILAVLLAASVILSCGTLYWGWFKKGSTAVDATAAADESNNLVVNDAGSSGISLAMTAISGSNELGGTVYSGTTTINGESVDYESSYAITATLDNEYATNQTITWSLAWASSSDNTLNDYVVLSADSSTSGEEITIYCLQAFDTQITLTATNGDVSDTCAIDYVIRTTGFELVANATCNDGQSDRTEYYKMASTEETVILSKDMGLYKTLPTYAGQNEAEITDIYSDILLLGGTGTIKDYSMNGYTLTLEFSDEVKSTIETALGLTNATYTNDEEYFIDKGTIEDFFNKLIGVDEAMSQDSYKYKVYTALVNYVAAGTPIFKITFNYTGRYTGKEYSFAASFGVESLEEIQVAATSLTINQTSIYF